MSRIAMTKPLLAGCIAYFVESGTVLPDGGGVGVPVTVSELAKPTVDPIDNWPQITCVQKMERGKDRKDYGAKTCYNPSTNSYMDEKREKTTRRYITLTLEETNELIERLSEGVENPIEPGTAQRPGMDSTERIYGWLKVQNRDIDLAQDHNVIDNWGYFELKEVPAVEGQYQTPQLEFTRLYADGNSVNWAITA